MDEGKRMEVKLQGRKMKKTEHFKFRGSHPETGDHERDEEAGWSVSKKKSKSVEDGGGTTDAIWFRDRDTKEKTGGRAGRDEDVGVLFGRKEPAEDQG